MAEQVPDQGGEGAERGVEANRGHPADLERRVDELQAALTEVWQHAQRLEDGLRTLAQHVDSVAAHADELTGHVAAVNARSWDQQAVARRLAVLEDLVSALVDPSAADTSAGTAARSGDI